MKKSEAINGLKGVHLVHYENTNKTNHWTVCEPR